MHFGLWASLSKVFTGRCSIDLAIGDDHVVYLKGINHHERLHAPPSIIRGNLNILVKAESIPVEEVHIKFCGKSRDKVILLDTVKRTLVDNVERSLIDDSYIYITHSSELVKGSYTVPFQFTIDPTMAESLSSTLGSRSYHLEVLFKSRSKLESMLCKSIQLIRCPLDNSLIPSESINAVGNWRNLISYHLSLSSKILIVGGTLELRLQTMPDLFNNESTVAVVTKVRVYFVQKTESPRMVTIPNEFLINKGDRFTVCNKVLLICETYLGHDNLENQKEVEEGFDTTWKLRLPNDMPFNLYPYTSNPEGDELLNMGDLKLLKITHFIMVTVTMKIIAKQNEECNHNSGYDTTRASLRYTKESYQIVDESSDLTFKAPIYLLHKLAAQYSPPPAYSEKSTSTISVKSSSSRCSRRKRDLGIPPAY